MPIGFRNSGIFLKKFIHLTGSTDPATVSLSISISVTGWQISFGEVRDFFPSISSQFRRLCVCRLKMPSDESVRKRQQKAEDEAKCQNGTANNSSSGDKKSKTQLKKGAGGVEDTSFFIPCILKMSDDCNVSFFQLVSM